MSYQENYLKWKNESSLKEPLKSELIQLTESEIEDAFYKELEFGTAGARGLMVPAAQLRRHGALRRGKPRRRTR